MSATVPAHRLFIPLVDERYDDAGYGPVEPLAEELPLPADLGDDKILLLTDGAKSSKGFFGRFRKRRGVHRAVRGAAMLARGYADISGGTFGEHVDAVWGFTSPHPRT